MFSPEGAFFRSFLVDELVKSIDALSREQLLSLLTTLGLQNARLPLLVPGASKCVRGWGASGAGRLPGCSKLWLPCSWSPPRRLFVMYCVGTHAVRTCPAACLTAATARRAPSNPQALPAAGAPALE